MLPSVIRGNCVMQDIDLAIQSHLGDLALWEWIQKSNELEKLEEKKNGSL